MASRSPAPAVFAFLLTMVLPPAAAAANYSFPAYQECISPLARSQPYCNRSLSVSDRVSSLVSSLTLKEKVSLLSPDPTLIHNDCLTVTSAVPRLGLGPYMWLTETNSQVNSACLRIDDDDETTTTDDASKYRCATAFPGALGLAASFNRTLWYGKGDVISTEMRALNNAHGNRTYGEDNPHAFVGLTGWGPNINIARDPRFGRTSELPGEDPYLSGQYAAHYLNGMQQTDSSGKYVKMLAFAKHYTAYSRETNRGHDTYDITAHDLFDTYLPQYEAAMRDGSAAGVMCSYNGINGRPSCANDFILNDVLRKRWDRPDAIVMTDCGAVSNLLGPPVHAPDEVRAAGWAMGNGTDVEAGTRLFRDHLERAVEDGLVDEESVLDASVTRTLTAHMRTGRFDPPPHSGPVEWTSILRGAVGSEEHVKARDDAARQTAVLLRNEGNALPLKSGSNVVLVGPMGDDGYGMLPDYFGDMVCPPPPSSRGGGEDEEEEDDEDWMWSCIPTFLSGLERYNGPSGSVRYFMGVDELSENKTQSYQDALDAVKADGVDAIVVAVGISKRSEYESHDRAGTSLPGLQDAFAREVLDAAAERDVPVVLLLTNGGALSVDNLLPPRDFSRAYDASAGTEERRSIELPLCYRSRQVRDIHHSGSPGRAFASAKFPRRFAVIEAYNPSLGAAAIFGALYGEGPISWGRMVTTMYTAEWAETHPVDQYHMAADGGRTYRWHERSDDLLAVFGEGMPSERPEDLHMSCAMRNASEKGQGRFNAGGNSDSAPHTWRVSCTITNLDSSRSVSALVMAFVRPSTDIAHLVGDRFPVPLRSLRAFERVVVPPSGSTAKAEVMITSDDLLLVNKNGEKEAVPGLFHLDIWDGWNGFATFDLVMRAGTPTVVDQSLA